MIATRHLRLVVLLCACIAPFGWLLFWAVFHMAPGQDWVVFHTAAARFWAHDLGMLGDPRAFTDEMNRSHAQWFVHPISVLHPFIYPPVTLLMTLGFCWLPYIASLVAFLIVTAGLLVAALWSWEGNRQGRLLLIAGVFVCPAAAYNIGAGQLSFLVAACVLSGMALLESRPFLSGMAFSLLCLKPQFVPLIPVALLAGRHWRAMAGGLFGGIALVLASATVLGINAWFAWIRLATGQNPLLGRMIDVVRVFDQSVHTCLHILGAGEGLAGLGQLAATAGSAVCVWLVFARATPTRQRVVVLLCAMVFGAPHVGDYDHMIPAAGAVLIALDARNKPQPIWLAGAVWLAPILNPPALIAVLGVPALTLASALTPLLPGWLMVRETRRMPVEATASA